MKNPVRSRLTLLDVLRVGSIGLRARRLRAALSALGICIGIAAIVAVQGVSTSSETALLDRIGALGNLLVVAPGKTFTNAPAQLPPSAPQMIRVVGPVTRVAATATLTGVTVRRSAAIPAFQTGSIAVQVADGQLPETLGVPLLSGVFLNGATARYPAVVLGYGAARTLGISRAGTAVVYLGGRYFTVVGILAHADLVPTVDTSAFIGAPIAGQLFNYADHPTTIYVRCDPQQVESVRAVLARTADPASPQNVQVSRPTDTLAAQAATQSSLDDLIVALGAVALLVAGVGIGNVMVIAVIERRTEIGLRRSLGATRRHIGLQFLTEAVLLSTVGGAGGTLLGLAITVGYAGSQHTGFGVPSYAYYGGVLAAVAVGTVAGLYPAARAARLAPTEALRTGA
jgi:putative ABC transport system permease protein